ncbi:DUF4124 domain-containing protein [Aliikangiella sp. IMCC44653]
MKLFLMLLMSVFVCVTGIAAEEKKKFYKWVDKNGNVHYSDQPQNGAKEIKIEKVPTVKIKSSGNPLAAMPTDEPASNATSGGAASSAIPYDEYTLLEPENNAVIRNNAGAITLTANLEPSLQSGHQIQFILDGSPAGEATSAMSLTLENIGYGEHLVGFVVLDENQKQVVSSKMNQFTLLNFINPKIKAQQKLNINNN